MAICIDYDYRLSGKRYRTGPHHRGTGSEALERTILTARRQRRALVAQRFVDVARQLAALGDRPHDQRRAAMGVAGAVHAGHAGGMAGVDRDVAPRVERDAELTDQRRGVRAGEAEREPVRRISAVCGQELRLSWKMGRG